MENGVDSTHPDFWTSRYAAGKTPWVFGGVPAALKSFLARSSAPGKVLIPGCGSGYEVQAFHEGGYDVTAIDFSPAAVDQAKRVLGVLAARVIFGDFFTYNFSQGSFDSFTRGHFSVPCRRPAGPIMRTGWRTYYRREGDWLASFCMGNRQRRRRILSRTSKPSSFSRDASGWCGVSR